MGNVTGHRAIQQRAGAYAEPACRNGDQYRSDEMMPTGYERAVLEWCRINWPAPAFWVRHDVKLPGKKSRRRRQIDVAIYEGEATTPFLVIEAKRRSRSVDLISAGSTIALVQDVGGIPAVMVAASRFSTGAANHLTAEGIGHMTITIKQAEELRWIPVLEKRFLGPGEFKEISGALVEALRAGDAAAFLDNSIPYEEWLAVVETGLSLFTNTTAAVLEQVCLHHRDSGHRYNAIQLLWEDGLCDQAFFEQLYAVESDPETLELLACLIAGEPH